MSIDLAAYLNRIGLSTAPATDSDGLSILQRAHRLAIPFENLDIPLGRGISLDPDAVFEKIVARRRGGYCFEQNLLFRHVLDRIGFEARPLLARVWLGADGIQPRTHTLSLVTFDGQPWIADAGFGGSYTPPMALEDGGFATAPDGAAYRLRQDHHHGWMLERLGDRMLTDGRSGDEGWQPQYSFTLDHVADADLEMSNHWTSTRPNTRFTSLHIVSLALPNGFAALTGRHYSRRNGDQHVQAEIESAKAYRLRLNFIFGISLTDEEVMQLGLYP